MKYSKIKSKPKSRTIKKYNKTYGAEGYKIEDTNIAFIRLNTALSSFGKPNDREKFQLVLGDMQKNAILREYEKIKSDIDARNEDLITFCLAHHPSSYLSPEDSQELNNLLISADRLNVDFFLSGHIHDGSLSNLSNHNRSMISLETGIGWPEEKNEASSNHKNHRYAIYCFDENKNIFYSLMYKTNSANQFKPDTDYLITDEESKTGKIYNPLKTRDYAFIPLNSFSVEDSQGLFVDRENINSLKLLFLKTKEFNDECNKILTQYEYRYIDNLAKSEKSAFDYNFIVELCKNILLNKECDHPYQDFNDELKKSIIDDGINNKQLVQIHFLAFLQHIATKFIKTFSGYFEQEAECRAVFRIYQKHIDNITSDVKEERGDSDIRDDFFEPICEYPAKTQPRTKKSGENASGHSRRFKYTDSLIEYAYKNNQSMIYSINQEKHYFKPQNWDDFIVIIPQIVDYTFTTNNESGKIINKRPPLSFVFSLRIKDSATEKSNIDYKKKFKKISNRLLLLQFTEIEKVISDLTKTFLEEFNVDINDFVDNLNKVKEEYNKQGDIKNGI